MSLRIQTPLKPHQTEAVAFLKNAIQVHGGGLNCFEMGLGKTLVTLQLFVDLAKPGARFLYVASSAVLLELRRQLEQHVACDDSTDEFVVVDYQGSADRRRQRLHDLDETHPNAVAIVLASWGTCRNDAQVALAYGWTAVALDECHCLKNPNALLTRAFRRLPATVPRIGMSGTPNANNPTEDLRTLSSVLFPLTPELHDAEAYRNGKPQALKTALIHRTLQDVDLELPPLNVWSKDCKLRDPLEEEVYEQQKGKTLKALSNFQRAPEAMRLQALKYYQGQLNMLGKAATHPQISAVRQARAKSASASGAVAPIEPINAIVSSKERMVRRVIGRQAVARGRKMVVTAVSTTFLNIVHAHLTRDGISSVLFTGETSQAQRLVNLRAWESPEGPNVLLLSMQAGGQGLTLTTSSLMVIVDGFAQPNPEKRAQVMKRVHRIGQTDPVTIVDLCTRGTIEEVMREYVHPSKEAMTEKLLKNIPLNADGKRQGKRAQSTQLQSIGHHLQPCWELYKAGENGGPKGVYAPGKGGPELETATVHRASKRARTGDKARSKKRRREESPTAAPAARTTGPPPAGARTTADLPSCPKKKARTKQRPQGPPVQPPRQPPQTSAAGA